MALLLPSTEIRLPGGYRWPPQLIDARAWQGHLLKHPLGLYALRYQGRHWGGEGWTDVQPPVISQERRDKLFHRIGVLTTADQPCGVPEVFGVAGPDDADPECYRCEAPLVDACRGALDEEGLGARYAEITESTVRALSGGTVVSRHDLAAVVALSAGRRASWPAAVVMSAGRAGDIPLVHFAAGNGVIVQLRIEAEGLLRWRTTYRRPEATGINGGWAHLLDPPNRDPELSLSEAYAVPRDWWQAHGL